MSFSQSRLGHFSFTQGKKAGLIVTVRRESDSVVLRYDLSAGYRAQPTPPATDGHPAGIVTDMHVEVADMLTKIQSMPGLVIEEAKKHEGHLPTREEPVGEVVIRPQGRTLDTVYTDLVRYLDAETKKKEAPTRSTTQAADDILKKMHVRRTGGQQR